MRLNNKNAIIPALACGVLAYVALNGQFYFDNNTTSIKEVNRVLSSQANGGPNVIYIQHESLSGSILLNTKEGKTSTPFFRDLMLNVPDFYVFEHHRTGSGNTIDAMPSLMTGCLPYTEKGMKYAHAKGRSIGHEFAKNGYSTASFSSRPLDEDVTKGSWKMMYDMLVGGMDRVEDATRNPKLKLDNAKGTSDGQMLPLFEEWLGELEQQREKENPTGEGAVKRPFYAQFYNFNQHYPYLDLKSKTKRKSEGLGNAYYASLKATDNFLETLFRILFRTGQLKNTIIVGSSVHGEEPFKARLYALNSNILHAAAYVYYPQNLMAHQGVAERLRRNTQELSYTLDMYPTLRSILNGVSGAVDSNFDDPDPMSDPDAAAAKGCITGIDLASVDIPDDRVLLGTNLASSKKSASKKNLQLYALMTKDIALYHRTYSSDMQLLGQGKNNDYVLQFDSCTHSTESLCSAELLDDKKSKMHFRRAVVSLRSGGGGSGFVGEKAKTSDLVKIFVDKIGGESVIEATKKVMEIEHSIHIGGDQSIAMTSENAVAIATESSMENSAVITGEAPLRDATETLSDPSTMSENSVAIAGDQRITMTTDSAVDTETQSSTENSAAVGEEVTEPLSDPPSGGSFLDLIHSLVQKMSWWEKDNPSCDGILLYMPDMSASIENQLNNYILATMMATFMNLSMVILDAPSDSGVFGSSSQSQLGCADMPSVLSSLVKPPEWLSSKCPVPCKKTHGYSDWNNLRQSSVDGIPETVCDSDEGHQSSVFVLGGGETIDYFEKYFKDSMLQRPSLVAYDWALRLGAEPEEADVFSELNGAQIWNYLGSLVARSDLLQFQPWILADVASYIKESQLPVDATDIWNGVKSGRTWDLDAIQIESGNELLHDAETNRIPLQYYLDRFECTDGKPPKRVYIATSDPEGVKEEISTLGQKCPKGQYRIGCSTYGFYFNRVPPNDGISCDAFYSRFIVDIAHFIIFSRVRTFIGNVHSDWGRLIRIFRLRFIIGLGCHGEKSPFTLTDTKVAVGVMPPARVPGWHESFAI